MKISSLHFLISGNQDQESHSTVQQEKDTTNAIANKRKQVKIQKRPLLKVTKPEQITTTEKYEAETAKSESEENSNTEKIYSSVLKEDHTLVQQKKLHDATKNEIKNEGNI